MRDRRIEIGTMDQNRARHRRRTVPADPPRLDRMLITQAQVGQLTLVTRDAHIQKYDVSVLPV
jgi:PIN domain nuclease of toxin-antitoxin system